ncbi:MAG: DHH family phosphoesterase [archaeon]
MKNNTFQEIWNKINECEKILISLHSGPDGDSLGSCTAMKYVLEKQDKDVTLISYDYLIESLQSMSITKEIDFKKDILDVNLENFDLLLCIDISTPEMIGKYKRDYQTPKNIFTINIDHHPTNKYYANLNYVDEHQPSATSILLEMFKQSDIEFDSELSTRLLLGLCTDCGFFTFAPLAEKALKQASFLIENGGKYLERVVAPILHQQPLNLMKYYSLLVMKLKFDKNKRFAYSLTTAEEIKKLGLNLAEIRLGPNHLQYLKEFEFIFTLVEVGNSIKGSFRSQKKVDVSLFAKNLGGGGHKSAAAFHLENVSLKQAEKQVLETIEKVGIHKF